MNIKKIISVVMIFAFLSTVFVSVSAIAADHANNDAATAEQVVNPMTGDFVFGIFVAAALVAILILYLVMRKKYVN